MAKIVVLGIPQVDAALKELGARVGNKVVRQGMRAGAKIVAAEIANRSPSRTGRMKSSVKVRTMKRSRKNRIGLIAGFGEGWFKGKTFYAAFVAFGHRLGKRTHKRSHKAGGGKTAAARAFKMTDTRPKVPPNPFMQEAFKSAGPTARQRAEQTILAGIARETAALRVSGPTGGGA